MNIPQIATDKLYTLFNGSNILVKTPPWLENIAFVSLCIYVFTSLLFNDFSDTFSILFTLIGIYLYWNKKGSRHMLKDPIILLFISAIIIQLLSWYLATLNHPNWSSNSPKLHQMGVWFKMIPFAVIIGGRNDRVVLCWLLAIASLLSAPFIIGNGVDEWLQGFNGKRVDFGFINAQHTTMLGAVLFLSVIAAFTSKISNRPLRQLCAYLFLTSLSCLISLVIIFTQTRGVWLGLFFSFPFFLLVFIFTKKQNLKKAFTQIFIGGAFIICILVIFQDTLSKRFFSSLSNSDSYSQALLKDGSFFYRYSTWEDGLKWAAKKPLLGWGGSIEKHIVSETSERIKVNLGFRHLHSSYLDTLTNYGVLGLIVLLALPTYLLYCSHKSWISNILPTPIYVFFISFLPFWFFINIFESYFYYSSGEYVLTIVGGIILSYYWRSILPEIEEYD